MQGKSLLRATRVEKGMIFMQMIFTGILIAFIALGILVYSSIILLVINYVIDEHQRKKQEQIVNRENGNTINL